jgi:hypothetical protein
MLKRIVSILTLTVLLGTIVRGDDDTDAPKVGDLLSVVLTGDAATIYLHLAERLPDNTIDQVPSIVILARVTKLEGTELDFEHKRTVLCNSNRFQTILAGRITASQMQRKRIPTDRPISGSSDAAANDTPTSLHLRLDSFSTLAQFRLEHCKRNEQAAD